MTDPAPYQGDPAHQPEAPLNSEDAELLTQVRDWLRAGQPVALFTLLATTGSTPRRPGALLAIGAHAGLVGSVSGGCVEEALIERVRSGDWPSEASERAPDTLSIGFSGTQAARAGLACGGHLELLVEWLDADALPRIQTLLGRLASGALLVRRLCRRTGELSLHPAAEGQPQISVSEDAVARLFGPAWELLLIGDGQIARALSRMAQLLDYRVTLCEPRADFRCGAPLPGMRTTELMPDDAVRALADHPRAAVVTLAHDPRQDDLALIEALGSRAFYIGALGSHRSAAARAERLAAMSLTPQQIARLDAPAGLAIGSKRPAEIALSILAGITAARNGAAATS